MAWAAAMLHYPPRQAEITPLGLLLRLEEEDRLPPLHRAAVLFSGPAASAALVLLGWYGTRLGHAFSCAWGHACSLAILDACWR